MINTLSHEECLRSVQSVDILRDFGFDGTNDSLENTNNDFKKIERNSQYDKTGKYTYVDIERNGGASCLSCILNQFRAMFIRDDFMTTAKKPCIRRVFTCRSPRSLLNKKPPRFCCVLLVFLSMALLISVIAYLRRGLQGATHIRMGFKSGVSSFRDMAYRQQQKRNPSLGSPFNPEKWSNETANTRQKYLILYWSKIRGHKARIQSKKEYEKNNHIWPYTYAGDDKTCPVKCELTNDRRLAKEASAFVVHSRLTDVWDFPPLEYLAPWILQNNENPVYTPALSDPRIMNKFNLLISYRLDSDFPSPIYPMPTTQKPIPFKQRLGNVLAVFSKCEIVRTEYMRQLMRHIEVHSYGACMKNKEGLIGLYGQVNGKYVFKDYKLVLTGFYKFSLVFMNQDCPYFVDDRLFHALDTGSIPVYMGTEKIEEFIPGNLRNSIIKVSDFNSPKELADYLKYLSRNESAFNEYLEWKNQGIGDISNTTIGRWWNQKYPLFCQVCMRLSQGNLHPGLDIDMCKPRKYRDWNLKPPYGIDVVIDDNSTKSNTLFSMNYDKPFYSIVILICFALVTCISVSIRVYHFVYGQS